MLNSQATLKAGLSGVCWRPRGSRHGETSSKSCNTHTTCTHTQGEKSLKTLNRVINCFSDKCINPTGDGHPLSFALPRKRARNFSRKAKSTKKLHSAGFSQSGLRVTALTTIMMANPDWEFTTNGAICFTNKRIQRILMGTPGDKHRYYRHPHRAAACIAQNWTPGHQNLQHTGSLRSMRPSRMV